MDCRQQHGYRVKRATTNGGPYTTVTTVTTVSYTNTGLTNGTTYYYVVSALIGTRERASIPIRRPLRLPRRVAAESVADARHRFSRRRRQRVVCQRGVYGDWFGAKTFTVRSTSSAMSIDWQAGTVRSRRGS